MKVLVVDDDHLARKGIISMMPWTEFGLQVVGEAENGKKALQFLEEHQVGLLITDIAMPTMSGIELIREVRLKFPHIWIVMLTFHQDFEYVQEALRLGAIDYIAKIELEKENMSEILRRILNKIHGNQVVRFGSSPMTPISSLVDNDKCYKALLLIALQSGNRPDFLKSLLSPDQYEFVYEVHKDAWLLTRAYPEDEQTIVSAMFERLHLGDKWVVSKISGMNEHNNKLMYKLLEDYINQKFFYEYRRDQSIYEVTLEQLTYDKPQLTEKDLYLLKESWSSLDIVYHQQRFQDLIKELERIQPSVMKLDSMFYSIIMQWEKNTSQKTSHLFEFADYRFWIDRVQWLREIRTHIRGKCMPSIYSDEVMAGIMKAVDTINQNLSMDLKLTEVAEEVHISRSYFSECFKNITGKTFNEYIRDARIEFSKSLLGQTNEPIYKIAEKCGYPDEKYFSKVFKRKEGKLPSELRKCRDFENKLSIQDENIKG
ncbi:two-component system, response regulator YesN [Paenibacillus sp. 1_12]|uniref:response regulator n=1 Tax=Paenibacillus sp. 1_12 TaxID=1566278 RepID=UPI0008EB4DBD|nr:response regulator [Paenibacillus sp. 1_12]SFL56303.1 two-component system, response regulator YesN [Paenibacillus sp. 1_12]